MKSANQSEKRSGLGPLQALGRVLRIFYAPQSAAREIREQPNWVFPLLLTLLLSFVTTAVIIGRPETQQALQKALESSGQKASELEKVKLLEAMRVVAWVGFLAAPVIANLFVAVVLWGATVMMEAKIGFIPVFSYQLHAQMVTLVPRTLGVAWILGRHGAQLTSGDLPAPFSLGNLLPAGMASPVLQAVAASVDLFALWYWAIIVAGLAVVAGVPWRRLLIPASFLWVLGVLLTATATLLSSSS
jgi:Yip1-like protein